MIKAVHHVRLDLTGEDEFFHKTSDKLLRVLYVYGLRGKRDLLVTGPLAESLKIEAFTSEVSFYDLPHNIQEAWREACR